MSERKVPKLRFAGFTDDWKQRKLGEVVFQIKSYSLSRNVETNKDTGFKYVHYGDIHRNIAKLLSSENNLPSIQKGNYEFLQKGDLVIADASEDYEGIGNSCLIDCFLSRNIVAGLHTIALRPTEVNSLFLYYLLHTDIFLQYGKVIATGTKVFGITAKNLLNFKFNLPSETEQQAIGEFFKQLDDTIAFHQREWEKYKNLKISYLEKMFPQENENKPQLRFPNFTDAWKQRKLGDILRIKSGMSQKNIEKENGIYPILATGGEIGRTDTALYVKESVLIGRKGTIDKPYYMNTPFWTVDTLFYSELFPDTVGLFVYALFQTIDWRSYDTSTGVPSLTSTTIHSINVKIPPSEAEQQAIGEFFKQLDDTIAFHQREWEKYKNLKISYLEKMFPQENENKPQLRFPNFTDAWKQRKLGEVTVQIKSYSLSRNVETNKDTGFKYVHYGDIHRNIAKLLLSENNLPSIQKGNYEFLQKGDLVIADASEDYEGIGNSCLVDCFLSRNIVAGLHTIALRPTEVNSLFLYYLLHTDIFSQYGKIIATGTKVFGITAKNLLNFEFYLPTETEQQAIGEFFKQLDDTIAFHQRELEKYQQLKQVLLDQLFV